MAAVLLPLPEDILYSICTSLPQRSHISSFTLTCKQFYEIGLPHFLNIPPDFNIDLRIESTTSFFQTLLHDHEYPQTRCRYVRVLNLRFYGGGFRTYEVQLRNIELLTKAFEYMDQLRYLILNFPLLPVYPLVSRIIQSLPHLINLRKLELEGNDFSGELVVNGGDDDDGSIGGSGGKTLVDDIEESLQSIPLSHIIATEEISLSRHPHPHSQPTFWSLIQNRQSSLKSLSLRRLGNNWFVDEDSIFRNMRFPSLHTLSIQIAFLQFNPLLLLEPFSVGSMRTLRILGTSLWPTRLQSLSMEDIRQADSRILQTHNMRAMMTTTTVHHGSSDPSHATPSRTLESIEITYSMGYVLGPTLGLMTHQDGVKKLILISCQYLKNPSSSSLLSLSCIHGSQTIYDDLKPQYLGWRLDLTDNITDVIRGLSENVQMSLRLQRLYIEINLAKFPPSPLQVDSWESLVNEYESKVLGMFYRLAETLHPLKQLKMIIICRCINTNSDSMPTMDIINPKLSNLLEPFMYHTASNFVKFPTLNLNTVTTAQNPDPDPQAQPFPSCSSPQSIRVPPKTSSDSDWSIIMQHYLKSLPNLQYLILQTRNTKFVNNRVTMLVDLLVDHLRSSISLIGLILR